MTTQRLLLIGSTIALILIHAATALAAIGTSY